MFLFVNILLMCFVPLSYTFNPQLNDIDLYGPMLAANEYLVVSIVDRTYPSFAVYRPYGSTEFCIFYINILSLNQTYAMQLTVPDGASATPDVFFYQGVTIGNGVSEEIAVVKVTITSMSNCSYTTAYIKLTSSGPSDYSAFDITTAGDIAIYLDGSTTFMYDYPFYNYTYLFGRPSSVDSSFIFYTLNIADSGWGIITGVIPSNGIYIPTLYLITVPLYVVSGSYNYVVQQTWTATFEFSWQSQMARSVSGSTDYDPMYGMCLSINNVGDILFGVQSMNTVFHLYVDPTNPTSLIFKGSRIASTTIPSIGFGKNVAWLDNTTAVILANNVSLDYTEWYSSQIEIYDLSNGAQLSNTQTAYSSFPTAVQSMYSGLTGRIVLMVASYAGSVIFMDSAGYVYIILPSPSGYYSATNIGNSRGLTVYFSSSSLCPPGTSRYASTSGKYLFSTCTACPEGTYNPGLINSSNVCLPCDTTKYFCPFASVAEVPLSYLNQISQATAFPKSPDLTKFEDVLLLNMFNTNFEGNCLLTTPFFWILIMFGITIVFLIIMGILKISGKCENYRTKIQLVFTHLDMINEGEVRRLELIGSRWIGGVLSLSILVIIIFAAVFTNSFLKQYPQKTSQTPAFTCDETLRNSQFSSEMISLGAAVSSDAIEIFNLLASQKLNLVVTLLNTIVNTSVTVEQTIGAITETLSADLSVPTNGCLTISCNLTANVAIINFNISSSQAIGGVGISLLGSAILDGNNEVQELDFSYSFSISNRTMSQEPYFNLELIQFINETKPLSLNDASQFSGLWIPTFTKDDDRNFQTLSDYETYHINSYTILTIDLTQAAYYIYNTEKPIVKTASVIFKNMLFASMCLEIFAFAFLFFKLVIAPVLRLIIRLVWKKEEENDNEESEKEEEEEEHESEDDGDEIPQHIKLEPGKNEWYMSDVKT